MLRKKLTISVIQEVIFIPLLIFFSCFSTQPVQVADDLIVVGQTTAFSDSSASLGLGMWYRPCCDH